MLAKRPDRFALRRISRIWQRGGSALQQLVAARQFARELARSEWDFAVEIDELCQAGLNRSDLRWLICQGVLLHAREVPPVGEQARAFRHAAPLTFSKASCFVLTEVGATLLNELLARVDRSAADVDEVGVERVGADGTTPLPCWDRARQVLRLGHVVVKQFKVPAANQERVLAAFEEEGWPVRLDDPLPSLPDHDPKRRLHDTINALNRNQKHRLIRFMGDGSGQGIRWALIRSNGKGDDSYEMSSKRTRKSHAGRACAAGACPSPSDRP